MTRNVNCEINDAIATVTIDRPDKRNAFDDGIVRELAQTFEALDRDDAVRVVVLTGSGSAFSSGADLEWMRSIVELDEEENKADALRLARMLERLDGLGKPTIARVNGHAFGGGLGLICCCDIAVAIESAKFSFSEVRLGIAPAVVSPFVVAAIGSRQARRLFLTGEIFGAEEAQRLSLIHEAVAADGLDAKIDEIVQDLTLGGPEAQHACKRLVRALRRLPPDKIADSTAAAIARLRTSEEGQAGLTAFLTKQTPPWRNK